MYGGVDLQEQLIQKLETQLANPFDVNELDADDLNYLGLHRNASLATLLQQNEEKSIYYFLVDTQ